MGCIGTLGKIGWVDRMAAFNQQINAVVPFDPDMSKWLFYAMMSPHFVRQMKANSSATTVAIINKRNFSALTLPIAPAQDQIRIVAAVETHFSRLDAAVAALTRAKGNVKRARASVLKAAVEGRLVTTEAELARAEGRDYEPAPVLLERILAQRKANWVENDGKGRYKDPIAPETGTLPAPPEGWVWATIDQVGIERQGSCIDQGWSPKCDRAPAGPEEWAVMTTTAIQAGYFSDKQHKRLPDSLKARPALQVEVGDLLITRAGPRKRAGVSCLVRNTRPKLMLCDKAYRFRVGTGTLAAFVEACLNSEQLLRAIEAMKSGISDSGVNITQRGFVALVVPLPPLAEQHRIVSEIDRRVSVLEALQSSIDANLVRCARLRQTILNRAFEGRLVPTGPLAELVSA